MSQTAGLFWAGCYTGSMGDGQGITALRPREDGSLELLGLAVATSSPSFVADGILPDLVYSTDEAGARVEAFRRGDGHALLPLGGQPVSGSLPCHLSVTAQWLYVSNYGDGSVDVFPLEQDGRIGPLAQTLHATGHGITSDQTGPHAHSTFVARQVLSADLGTDQVHVQERREGVLTRIGSVDFPPGTGPRDFAAPAPDAGPLYLVGELGGTVFALARGESGDVLPAITASGRVVRVPAAGDHGSGLGLSADGRYLYTGLRGSNRIAIVRTVDLGAVTDISCGGDWPRNLCVAGDMIYVANQRSGTVTSFRIEPVTGVPYPVGTPEPVPSATFILPARGIMG